MLDRWLMSAAVVVIAGVLAVEVVGRSRAAAPHVQVPAPPAPEPGKTSPIESNVARGMRWLRDHQHADGSWGDPATTGLVLLVFSGAGETRRQGVYRDCVSRALDFLESQQDKATGGIGQGPLCDHAVAAMALTEHFGMTGDRSSRAAAQLAVDFAFTEHVPGPVRIDAGEFETAARMATLLKSAELSQLDVDRRQWAQLLSAVDGPRTRASKLSDDACRAIELLVGVYAGRRLDDTNLAAGAAALTARLPAADTSDLPYMYFGTCAMLGIGGPTFRRWLPAMNAFVAVPSHLDAPQKGSWDPPDGDTSERGRIWTTAYHLLLCECFYGQVGHAAARK